MKTSERILIAATNAFGEFGYDATSLDDLAKDLGIRKQSILYHFPSKEQLLIASADKAISELVAVLDSAIARSENGWGRVEAVVKSVFRLAIRRPELLGLLREITRLGHPVLTRAIGGVNPLFKGATDWMRDEMEQGRIRESDPELLVLSIYSTVMGAATEIKLFEAIGEKQPLRGAALRRKELLRFLESALAPKALL